NVSKSTTHRILPSSLFSRVKISIKREKYLSCDCFHFFDVDICISIFIVTASNWTTVSDVNTLHMHDSSIVIKKCFYTNLITSNINLSYPRWKKSIQMIIKRTQECSVRAL